MITIHLMHNSDSFEATETDATTVGALKSELGVTSTSQVNVNTNPASNDQELNNGDIVAIVSQDKKGGY